MTSNHGVVLGIGLPAGGVVIDGVFPCSLLNSDQPWANPRRAHTVGFMVANNMTIVPAWGTKGVTFVRKSHSYLFSKTSPPSKTDMIPQHATQARNRN